MSDISNYINAVIEIKNVMTEKNRIRDDEVRFVSEYSERTDAIERRKKSTPPSRDLIRSEGSKNRSFWFLRNSQSLCLCINRQCPLSCTREVSRTPSPTHSLFQLHLQPIPRDPSPPFWAPPPSLPFSLSSS